MSNPRNGPTSPAPVPASVRTSGDVRAGQQPAVFDPSAETDHSPEFAFMGDALDAASTVGLPIPLAPAQIISRPCVLQQIRGPLAPQVIELDRDSLVVGRADDADIKIPSSALSRRHVRMERYHGSYRLHDLDSSNGVYLNEIRIHTAVLRDGDTIQLGNAVFIYHEGK